MNNSKWRVYYEDGSTWDWKQGFEGMPSYGVICILQITEILDSHENPSMRYHIVSGCPYFMRFNGEWLHAYENDIVDRLAHGMQIEWLLVGRMTTKRLYSEAMNRAGADKRAENL